MSANTNSGKIIFNYTDPEIIFQNKVSTDFKNNSRIKADYVSLNQNYNLLFEIRNNDTTYTEILKMNSSGLDITGNITVSGTVDGVDIANLASTALTSIPTASSTTLGGIKVGTNLSIDENGVLSASGGGGGSGTITSITAGTGLSGGGTSGDVTVNLDEASSTTLGGIKVGYTENDKNYPVELTDSKAFVNVPWTDTTYTVGDGGLTQNNFTDTLKTKLDGIEENADVTDAANILSAGAVMTSGDQSIAGNKTFSNNVVITNNLTVNGTTTTISTTNLIVQDKNIVLAQGAANDAAADGGGITVTSGDGNKTIVFTDSTNTWDLSEHVNVPTNKEFKIAGTSVLNATTLGSSIVNSSLTSLGTIATGTWQGTAITDTYIASASTWNAKQSALTFGIANTNAVKIDSTSVAENDYAVFTDEGIEGVSVSEVKEDLSLNNVTNESKATMFTNPTFTGTTTVQHIIPETDDTYDIGSAEKKIRDMYISDNSLWIGDEHKIAISNGKMKFRKRKKSVIPASIVEAGGTLEDIRNHFPEITSASDMKIHQWTEYARTLGSMSTANISDIFRDNSDDYEEEASSRWIDSGNHVYFNDIFGNVGIGLTNPTSKLHVDGDIKFTGTLYQGDSEFTSGSSGISVKGKSAIGATINQSNITTLEFDNSTGFNLDDSVTNKISVSLGSHWKDFIVSGQTTLSPSGEENIEFVAGNNVTLTTDTTSTPKKLTISASGGGGGTSAVNSANQTFAQLMTQQPNKFNQNGTPTITSSSITINWNYTDIIPTDQTIRKFAQGTTIKSRCLPFINEIKVQIKGTVTGTYSAQNNTWIDYQTLSISNTQDYNTTNSLKTITFTKTNPANADNSAVLNILSKTTTFYVRVYGINNNDNDFPTIDSRALEINGTNGVSFLTAAAPSQPLFQSNQSKFSTSNNHYLTSNFKVAQTESGVDDSTAVVDDYITTFTENTSSPNHSLRSGYFTLSPHSSTTSGSLSNIAKNTNFTIKVGNSNLRAGTKYDYTITVTNNISSANSAASDSQTSPYTRLPTSTNNTTLTLTEGTTNTNVTTSTLNNSSVIYLNSNISGKTQFIPSRTSTQTIEITKPYTSTQEDTTTGFGRFVDDIDELATVGIKINNTTEESIVFNGFKTTSGSEDDGTITQSGTTYFYSSTIQDMYSSDDDNKGFRLKGTVRLKNISISNIGSAQAAPHTLQYTYERHNDVGSATTGSTYNIYIDNLSGNPTIAVSGTDSLTVTSVEYCMGIPSVEKFTVNLQRNYGNINSSYGFIPGNKRIGRILSIEDTSWSSVYDTLTQAQINSTGNYSNDYTSTNKYYTTSKNGSDTLSITEYAYSLKGTTTSTSNRISVNHYFDKSSFNGTSSLTPKVSLTDIYEITNSTELAKLGSNIGSIGVTNYSSHTTVVQDHTLLYINGGFRTNASFTYPNVNSYSWDVTIPDKYNAGTTAFDTSGSSDTYGYKWIVFQVNQSDHTTESIAGTNYKYYGVKSYLENTIRLSSSTVSKIKDKDNNDAVGFVTQTVSSAVRVGNLSRDFNTSDAWYSQSSSISYSTMASGANKAKYGSNHNAANGNWGPLLDTDNGDNDIYIFIGLKNTVNLS